MRRVVLLFFAGLCSICSYGQTTTPALTQEFIYEGASFPSCHASTIVELQNGDLFAAWFGGQYEGHPDVKIWTSRKYYGATRWTHPVVAADGTFQKENGEWIMKNGAELARIAGLDSTDHGRKACYNPVLCQMPDGEVLLFFKIGRFVQDWTGWLVRSRDNGLTWSEKEPLPEGFLGPVKNKPELTSDGRLLCPSSTEKEGWKIHFEAYQLDKNGHFPEGKNLSARATMIGPVVAEQAVKTFEDEPSPIGCIQPSILRLADGRLKVLCRSQNGRLATSYSSDEGRTWTPVVLSDLPNNNSGTDAVTLKDGRHVLVYNPIATPKGENGGARTPLTVAVSDDGEHWRQLATLEDSNISEYSYPAVISGRDGTLHITYTWRRELIRYAELRLP